MNIINKDSNKPMTKGQLFCLLENNANHENEILLVYNLMKKDFNYANHNTAFSNVGYNQIGEKLMDMDKPITIGCPDHGDFSMTPNDHLGNNKERIAYGCPKCKDEKVIGRRLAYNY
jgi:hypothetical protein